LAGVETLFYRPARSRRFDDVSPFEQVFVKKTPGRYFFTSFFLVLFFLAAGLEKIR